MTSTTEQSLKSRTGKSSLTVSRKPVGAWARVSAISVFLKREDSEVAAVGFIEWLGLGGKSDTDQG